MDSDDNKTDEESDLNFCRSGCHYWFPSEEIFDNANCQYTHTTNQIPEELGGPSDTIDSNKTYTEICQDILTDEILLEWVKATNVHGAEDPEYKQLPLNETGTSTLRAFLVVVGQSQARNVPLHDIWNSTSTNKCFIFVL